MNKKAGIAVAVVVAIVAILVFALSGNSAKPKTEATSIAKAEQTTAVKQATKNKGKTEADKYASDINKHPQASTTKVATACQEPQNTTLSGVVSELANGTMLLSVDSAHAYRYVINANTKVTGVADKVAVGDSVVVVYKPVDDGTPTALNINVVRQAQPHVYTINGKIAQVGNGAITLDTGWGSYVITVNDDTRYSGDAPAQGCSCEIAYTGELANKPIAVSVYCIKIAEAAKAAATNNEAETGSKQDASSRDKSGESGEAKKDDRTQAEKGGKKSTAKQAAKKSAPKPTPEPEPVPEPEPQSEPTPEPEPVPEPTPTPEPEPESPNQNQRQNEGENQNESRDEEASQGQDEIPSQNNNPGDDQPQDEALGADQDQIQGEDQNHNEDDDSNGDNADKSSLVSDDNDDSDATSKDESSTDSGPNTESPTGVLVNAKGAIAKIKEKRKSIEIKLENGKTIKLKTNSDTTIPNGYLPTKGDVVKIQYDKDNALLVDIQLVSRDTKTDEAAEARVAETDDGQPSDEAQTSEDVQS